MKLIKRILFSAAVFSASVSYAQNYLGVITSNYAGVMGTDLQPASFVDGRFVVDVNLGSSYFNFYTNAMSFDTKGMPAWWTKSFLDSTVYNSWAPQDGQDFMDQYIIKNYAENSTKTLGAYNNMQLDVLNFAFHINPKIAIGFSTKFRSITNIDNVDPQLVVLAENSLNYPSLWNTTFNEELFSVQHMTWGEYGFNYGQVIKDDGEHFMKVGGRLKYLTGIASMYIHTNNFNYDLKNDDFSNSLSGDFSYGYSANVNGVATSANPGFVTSSFGMGGDLGFVYEWRPEWKEHKYDMDGETNIWRRNTNKYKLRAGVSLLDMGGMKFQKSDNSRDFSVNSANLFDLHTFDADTSLADFNGTVDSLIQVSPDWTAGEDVGSTYFMKTPTALSIQFDYHIGSWFYVNATGMLNVLSKRNGNHVHIANQFSITPSFDHPWVGVYLPMSYNQYSGFKAGIATRLGPLTIGMTDFRTLFAAGKVSGTEFYLGLRVPVLYGHPGDADGDKVSDEKDECDIVPGVWAFKGCPDTDGDGIKDTDDNCPEVKGPIEFKGCPDTDGDKIIDKEDACPKLAGIAQFKGCPDRDNDSIIDPEDDCPDVAGLKRFSGCPDTDSDGIKDDDDACPEVNGPLENQGCPDTDKDGLFDFLDDCPEMAGPKENKGCPWPDTDKDGLLDKDDDCPNLAGPIPNKGCPYQDTDKDGVLDKDDDCPATAGPASNKGCPVIEKEVEEILKTAFSALEFENGKDIIKASSFASLDELAEVLKKKPNWGLQLTGHTDNVGDEQKNLVLSKKRAEAVKVYLASKGVDESRFYVLYFGESQPIVPNDSDENKQKNRRVDMVIIFK